MRQIAAILVTFTRDERGATALEYCFIAALISIAAVAVLTQIGMNVSAMTGGVLDGLR
ncbi:Flp family type IVb pilin [Bosea sp. Root381]|uniref:Flp family type IVb pilin n=1 Tax=Bosea sp. Root381 TaxID=1736524 RepID=UPI0012E351B1|nr:Flp family type IVb pilin [Bosea sp. Root381]